MTVRSKHSSSLHRTPRRFRMGLPTSRPLPPAPVTVFWSICACSRDESGGSVYCCSSARIPHQVRFTLPRSSQARRRCCPITRCEISGFGEPLLIQFSTGICDRQRAPTGALWPRTGLTGLEPRQVPCWRRRILYDPVGEASGCQGFRAMSVDKARPVNWSQEFDILGSAASAPRARVFGPYPPFPRSGP